jgi:conjugal transfer pilin signal peptidase TrbI
LSLKNLNKKIEDFERKPTIVPNGYVLLMGTEPRSYDGRYWGFAPQKMVIDRAIPIL